MSIAAAGRVVLPGRARSRDLRLLAVTMPATIADQPDNLWYRFIVTDGTDTDYYADDTAALDGGLGAPTDDPVDNSWALMQYVPGFTAPAWAKDAVIYQIFPDRFRNGRTKNDPKTGDVRYDDPGLRRCRGASSPEGYCRNYADGDANCPWRFDTTPPTTARPRSRRAAATTIGGDLKGVDQQLDYLAEARRQRDLLQPDLRRRLEPRLRHARTTRRSIPYFGDAEGLRQPRQARQAHGIRVILDGVFNHMSSDSPLFDRYHHYTSVGACESPTSPYRTGSRSTTSPGTGTCVRRPAGRLGDLRRLVRLRLDPGADQVAGRRSRSTS